MILVDIYKKNIYEKEVWKPDWKAMRRSDVYNVWNRLTRKWLLEDKISLLLRCGQCE